MDVRIRSKLVEGHFGPACRGETRRLSQTSSRYRRKSFAEAAASSMRAVDV